MTITLKPHGTLPHTAPETCERKEWFRNEGAAWREVFKLREVRNYPASLQPYRCNQCTRWHIGNDPRAVNNAPGKCITP